VLEQADVKTFVRQFRCEILDEWKKFTAGVRVARELPSTVLIQYVPALLDHIAELVDACADEAEPFTYASAAAQRQALSRLDAGLDVASVVEELGLLRRAMLTVWHRAHADADRAPLVMNFAVD
jgi:hypothetical protein